MTFFQRIYYYSYSIFFCLRYLPFQQAIKIPILVSPKIKIGTLKRGRIVLEGTIRHSRIILGLPGAEGRAFQKTMISIHKGCHLIFQGNATLAEGTRIIIRKGVISIGKHFFCNCNCIFDCSDNIDIGNDNMYGWNISFNNTDGHTFYDNGKKKDNHGPIKIGNHVWIASYCNVFKNTEIADNCVVAQNSLVSQKFYNPNYLIGGIPAKELKGNINWTRK